MSLSCPNPIHLLTLLLRRTAEERYGGSEWSRKNGNTSTSDASPRARARKSVEVEVMHYQNGRNSPRAGQSVREQSRTLREQSRTLRNRIQSASVKFSVQSSPAPKITQSVGPARTVGHRERVKRQIVHVVP